jgi:hypothetical protein
MQRVHIVGPPRTGTSLMLELMCHGFEFESIMRTEIDVLEPPPKPWRTVLTKRPRDHVAIEPVLRADKGHWFIFMLRDPRDVVVSRHPQAPDKYWASLAFWRAAAASVATMRDHPQLLIVRYEQLVTEPDQVQRQLEERLKFLLRKQPFSSFSEQAKLTTKHRPNIRYTVDQDSIGRWRQNKERLAGQLQIHGSISQELAAWGYEADEAWLAELEGVIPDLAPGFFSEQVDGHFAKWRQEARDKLPGYLGRLEQLRKLASSI